MKDWLKIILISLGVSVVIIVLLVVFVFFRGRSVEYTTVDTEYMAVTPGSIENIYTPAPMVEVPEEEEPAEEIPTGPDENGWYEKDDEIQCTVDVLNVRAGTSAETDAIGSLSYGEQAHRTGENENGWTRIEYDDGIGYVKSEYVQVVGE